MNFQAQRLPSATKRNSIPLTMNARDFKMSSAKPVLEGDKSNIKLTKTSTVRLENSHVVQTNTDLIFSKPAMNFKANRIFTKPQVPIANLATTGSIGLNFQLKQSTSSITLPNSTRPTSNASERRRTSAKRNNICSLTSPKLPKQSKMSDAPKNDQYDTTAIASSSVRSTHVKLSSSKPDTLQGGSGTSMCKTVTGDQVMTLKELANNTANLCLTSTDENNNQTFDIQGYCITIKANL